MAFEGPLKARKKVCKKLHTSNFYDFTSRGFTETIRSKQPAFSQKVCIKESLEDEETQVVRCGHPQNIYFMLNSTTTFHCDIFRESTEPKINNLFVAHKKYIMNINRMYVHSTHKISNLKMNTFDVKDDLWFLFC